MKNNYVDVKAVLVNGKFEILEMKDLSGMGFEKQIFRNTFVSVAH
jgi:hypothetical protein